MMKAAGVYRSGTKLAIWTAIFLVAGALVDALAAISTVAVMPLIDQARFGTVIPNAQAVSHDGRQQVLAGCQLGISLVAIILFCMWVYRMNRNSWALGIEGMKYTPGWSVGWFFIPLAGLWMPCLVIRELWRANNPENQGYWRKGAVSPLVGIWWVVSLINAIIHYSPWQTMIGNRRLAKVAPLGPHFAVFDTFWADFLWEWSWGSLLADIAGIAGSLLTVALVVQLTDLQERKRAMATNLEVQHLITVRES